MDKKVKHSYISGQQWADHVDGAHDEEGDADVILVSSGLVLDVQLQEGLEGGLAAEADEVVHEGHRDGGILEN